MEKTPEIRKKNNNNEINCLAADCTSRNEKWEKSLKKRSNVNNWENMNECVCVSDDDCEKKS